MSPSYRNDWTPEREKLTTPMPHMARLPIHAYNDGEVSFQSPVLATSKTSRHLSFSSDEEVEEGDEFLKWTRRMKYGSRGHQESKDFLQLYVHMSKATQSLVILRDSTIQ